MKEEGYQLQGQCIYFDGRRFLVANDDLVVIPKKTWQHDIIPHYSVRNLRRRTVDFNQSILVLWCIVSVDKSWIREWDGWFRLLAVVKSIRCFFDSSKKACKYFCGLTIRNVFGNTKKQMHVVCFFEVLKRVKHFSWLEDIF